MEAELSSYIRLPLKSHKIATPRPLYIFAQNVLKSEKMNMSEEKVTIRIDLTDDLAREFLYLKKRKGIKNNSELVRPLIAEEYQRLAGRQI